MRSIHCKRKKKEEYFKPMKIAIDCRWSGKSGIGAFFDGILPYLKKSTNELFLFGTNEIPCAVKTFSVKEIFCFPRNLLKEINKCDVYFTPYCNIPGGIKIPIYTTIHDVVFLDIPKLASKLGIFVRKIFYKRAIKKSRALFTVSEFSKGRIIKTLHCKKPIFVVHNALPEYLLNFDISQIKKTNSILFVGNIKKHKGLSILLDAFPSIYEKTGAKLLIVGSQEHFRTQDRSIETKIDDINVHTNNSIEFTGFVENERLKTVLASSRILVQPSLYEGFGRPPLEALTTGTNAVISDIEVFHEIYDDFPVIFFKSGDSADLAEKVIHAWDFPPPVAIPQKYSFEKTANSMLEILKQ